MSETERFAQQKRIGAVLLIGLRSSRSPTTQLFEWLHALARVLLEPDDLWQCRPVTHLWLGNMPLLAAHCDHGSWF